MNQILEYIKHVHQQPVLIQNVGILYKMCVWPNKFTMVY